MPASDRARGDDQVVEGDFGAVAGDGDALLVVHGLQGVDPKERPLVLRDWCDRIAARSTEVEGLPTDSGR